MVAEMPSRRQNRPQVYNNRFRRESADWVLMPTTERYQRITFATIKETGQSIVFARVTSDHQDGLRLHDPNILQIHEKHTLIEAGEANAIAGVLVGVEKMYMWCGWQVLRDCRDIVLAWNDGRLIDAGCVGDGVDWPAVLGDERGMN